MSEDSEIQGVPQSVHLPTDMASLLDGEYGVQRISRMTSAAHQEYQAVSRLRLLDDPSKCSLGKGDSMLVRLAKQYALLYHESDRVIDRAKALQLLQAVIDDARKAALDATKLVISGAKAAAEISKTAHVRGAGGSQKSDQKIMADMLAEGASVEEVAMIFETTPEIVEHLAASVATDAGGV